MKSSTRTLLFFTFCAIFAITAPAIILYSQGYRIDWKNISFVKTGALFVEARPAPIELLLDDKSVRRSSFVFQNIYTGNLFPKNYQVEIKKDGYLPWKKHLAIAPKFVTEVKNVILFPKDPSPKQVASDITDFSLSPSERLIATIKNTTPPQINIFTTGEEREFIISVEDSTTTERSISAIQWNNDSSQLAILLHDSLSEEWAIIDLGDMEKQNITAGIMINYLSSLIISNLDFKNHTRHLYKPTISNVRWSEQNSNELFLLAIDRDNRSIMFSYDLKADNLSLPLAYDVLSYVPYGNKIFYLSATLKTINSIDLSTHKTTQHSFSPTPSMQNFSLLSDVDIEIIYPYLLLRIEGQVYLHNLEEASLKKLATGIQKATITNDAKKILLVAKNRIYTYWLTDIHIQPFRDSGDMLQITQENSAISDAIWLTPNNEHIIYSGPDGIKITELDTRDEQNMYTMIDNIDATKMLHHKPSGRLYYLTSNLLYFLEID